VVHGGSLYYRAEADFVLVDYYCARVLYPVFAKGLKAVECGPTRVRVHQRRPGVIICKGGDMRLSQALCTNEMHLRLCQWCLGNIFAPGR
jgi:hypothetical protein